MITSDSPRSLQNRNIPWRQAVEKVLAPLIETQEDPENQGECFCYLFHSTVKDFLISNQGIFQQDPPKPAIHAISELTIANACLLYLSQNRYSQILTKEGGHWVTNSKDNVEDHHLLTYAAKYWDKHLDNVDETPKFRQYVEDFLISPNFMSTIQVQSLFVQSHFQVYTAVGGCPSQKFTKRVFPRWFASYNIAGCAHFFSNYRSYISEWHSLLDYSDCKEPHCGRSWTSKPFLGEIDRCLWGALGPGNFLSSNRGRYTSFMLRYENGLEPGNLPYHEAISQDGNKVLVLQLSDESTSEGNSTFNHQTWRIKSQAIAPLLSLSTTISTDSDRKKWASPNLKLLSFTSDLGFLRIGTHIFAVDSGGEYHAVEGLNITSRYPNAYFEGITSRGSLLVVASRTKLPAIVQPQGPEAVKADLSSDKQIASSEILALDSKSDKGSSPIGDRHSSRDPSKRSHATNASDTSSAKERDSSDKDGSDSDSSCPSDDISKWNSAEESWSEGSTEVDELGNPLTSSDDSSSNSSEAEPDSDDESEAPQDDGASDTAVNSYGQMYEESDSDGGDVDFDCGSDSDSYEGDYESDWSDYNNHEEDLHFDSDDEERLVRQMAYSRQDRKRDAKVQQGVLTIYDVAVSPPNPIFTFVHQLAIMLYDSPPVIHPTEPLVVWPLCGGDVLFADFEGKSYFIRRARTTTHKSRSPKCSSARGYDHNECAY